MQTVVLVYVDMCLSHPAGECENDDIPQEIFEDDAPLEQYDDEAPLEQASGDEQ